MRRFPLGLLLLAAALAGAACRTRRDPCGDPVESVRAFVAAMEAGDRQAAFDRLSRAARQELERRAAAASATLEQQVAPADLLVPERSVLPRIEWLTLRSKLDSEAWIEIKPPAPAAGRPATDSPWSIQRLVREDGCWKIDLFHAADGS